MSRSSLTSRWTQVGGWAMHARVSTDSRPRPALPLVLVHGIGISSRYMVPLAERLAADWMVYAVDLLGFGKSDKPRHVLDVAEHTDCLAAWCDAEGLTRVAFVGNSFGCQVLTALAARHPDLVERLVLIGPTTDPEARTPWQQAWRAARVQFYEPPHYIPLLLYDALVAGPRRDLVTFAHALRDPILERLPAVAAPTLVLRGEHDAIAPQRWVETLAATVQDGRVVVVPGEAHVVHYSAPEVVASYVETFLDSMNGYAETQDSVPMVTARTLEAGKQRLTTH